MLRQLPERWLDLWRRLDAKGDATRLFEHLRASYSEPHRRYHTLEHLGHGFAEFDAARALARRPEAVEMALWFHDVTCDPRASDNEERSAQIMEVALRPAGLSAAFCRQVAALILATTHRAPPREADAQLLADVDLSILGQPPARFDEYERQIREEYEWVPDALFAEQRRAILQSFVQRQRIFATAHFRSRCEWQARDNLARSLAQLENAPSHHQSGAQPDLPLLADETKSGYDRWQQQRRDAVHQLARKLNLPLGHAVEIWLRGNVRLRGTLRLREEMIFVEQDADPRLQLQVDGVPFSTAEIEACVRQD